jgi:hypothetical protein
MHLRFWYNTDQVHITVKQITGIVINPYLSCTCHDTCNTEKASWWNETLFIYMVLQSSNYSWFPGFSPLSPFSEKNLTLKQIDVKRVYTNMHYLYRTLYIHHTYRTLYILYIIYTPSGSLRSLASFTICKTSTVHNSLSVVQNSLEHLNTIWKWIPIVIVMYRITQISAIKKNLVMFVTKRRN